jgi:dihydroorotase
VEQLTLTRPDDWHLHVRDGAAMESVIADTARTFGRAIIMPNLRPPVTTTAMALAYRDRIISALPADTSFEPLMTLYLTDNTREEEIAAAKASGHIHAVKLYPAGATTNSDEGVTNIANCYDALEAMSEHGLPLLVHGEVTSPDIDIFDREKIFIEQQLQALCERFPKLKIVFEHITTKHAMDFVLSASDNVAATITAHHLLLNRNAMLVGGIQPHHYCLPVLKREQHRQALIEGAISGNPKFFLGTDSAPHSKEHKESACGCAGMYTAHAAIELYAEIFEQVGALDKLEAFASFYGADFYGLPRNTDTITLQKNNWTVPEKINFGENKLVPFRAGAEIQWKQAS